jgi:hypothetical protein
LEAEGNWEEKFKTENEDRAYSLMLSSSLFYRRRNYKLIFFRFIIVFKQYSFQPYNFYLYIATVSVYYYNLK